MRDNIEKRLHRVRILLQKGNAKCPYSNDCVKVTNCYRCNIFYEKCSIYLQNLEQKK